MPNTYSSSSSSEKENSMSPSSKSRIRGIPYMPSYMTDGQSCAVCGDIATGLHYSAITCEGCKGFFRRTSQRGLKYECKDQQRCIINKDTRNYCQSCRLAKCYAVGMSNELVLNENERVHKRELIKENRARRSSECTAESLRKPIHKLLDAALTLAPTTRSITKAFLNNLDDDREPLTIIEEAVTNLIRRVRQFGSALPFFDQLSKPVQSTLCSRNFFGVQLFRIASSFDPDNDSFKLKEEVEITRSQLIMHLPQPLVDILFKHAATIAELELDNRSTAIFAALMLVNPTTKGVDDVIVEQSQSSLLVQLYALASEETNDMLPAWFHWPPFNALLTEFRRDSERILQALNNLSEEGSELFAKMLSV